MTVKDRQCLLTFLKRSDGSSYYSGEIDGIHGPQTQRAIRDFRKDFGGPAVTGGEDAETDMALRRAVAEGVPGRDQPERDPGASAGFWEEIEFFIPDEMRCKCNGSYCGGFPHEIQPLLMQILDRARRWSGHPIQVVSGLRCRQWNAIQGGVDNSQHMYGEAVDVYFYGVSPDAALAWLQSQPDVRYAYRIQGSSNIHFDIRPVGR